MGKVLHTKNSTLSAVAFSNVPSNRDIYGIFKGMLYSKSVWYYHANTFSFTPITLGPHSTVSPFTSLEQFIEAVKKCFTSYFYDLYMSYLQFFTTELSKNHPKKNLLKTTVTYKTGTGYYFVFFAGYSQILQKAIVRLLFYSNSIKGICL